MDALIIEQANSILLSGGIIAYPTEAVYGLGCDPFNETAVLRLLSLKQRAVEKGLILIAADPKMVQSYIEFTDEKRLAEIFATWPGPVTWVFPAKSTTPKWITGKFNTVAFRVPAHPIALALTQKFGKPLVSTSANIATQAPGRDWQSVERVFATQLDYIIEGTVGGLLNPSAIRDAKTGDLIRTG
jgi:L-threonylcarbamoyladenylate synthase